MAEGKQWRRRNYFVRKRFQTRFIVLLLLQMSIILTALGLVIYAHVQRTGEIAMQLPVTPDQYLVTQHELLDNVHGFYTHSLALIGLTTLTLLGFGLLTSHRLAGPVVKLENYVNTVTAGDYSQRITFRRNDHLEDFAGHVNRATEALENRRLRAREITIELARRAQHLGTSSTLADQLEDIDGLLVELREVV